MLVNLDGIPPAQADLRKTLAVKVGKLAARASRALRVAGRQLDAPHAAGPDIERREARLDGAGAKQFQRVGNLQRRHYGSNGIQHAHRIASGLRSARPFRIYAAKTGAAARQDRHGHAVTPHRGPVDTWRPAADAVVVDQITGLEIIRTVEDERRRAEQLLDVGGR